MIIREVLEEEKEAFNKLAPYPVQSWEWGQFGQKCGLKVIRLGLFDDEKINPRTAVIRPSYQKRLFACNMLTKQCR